MKVNFIERGGLRILKQGALTLVVILTGIIWHRRWAIVPVVVLGGLLLLVAAVCGLAGAVKLGRHLTPYPAPSAQSRLVQTGIYALVRHPLYLADICGALGWSLVCRSWPDEGLLWESEQPLI